jgi:hypothetical protein
VSGLLLGWKKNSGDFILPKSHEGTSTNFEDWLPLDQLNNMASQYLHDSISPILSTELDRMDIRKDLGMVKFIYKNHYWGIQLDGASGKLLSKGLRRADFLENLHDGSILDKYMGSNNSYFKLIYTSLIGLALITFTITGFWLWYAPKRVKKNKLKNNFSDSQKKMT